MHNYLNKVGYEIGCLTYNRKYVLKKRNLMLQMPQIGYATIEYDDDIARVVNISQFSVKELSS